MAAVFEERRSDDPESATLRKPLAVEHLQPDRLSSNFGKDKILLGLLFCGWYTFNVLFNIINKQVLTEYHYPLTCTTMQFFVGSVIAVLSWILQVLPVPALSRQSLLPLAALAAVHTAGNFLTNVSLGRVSVSFTHTVKALEPFFSVALSYLFMGQKPTVPVVVSLAVVVAGVICSTLHEPSFNWMGFACAMGSNVTFQSRNVISKTLMNGQNKDKKMDNITLFSVITILSFFLSLPITFALEGFTSLRDTMGVMPLADRSYMMAPQQLIYAGFFFHAYQQISYVILERVSPVTHSIGNCFKRVVIILVSVLFFGNHVGVVNAIGIAIALLGVFAYTRCKAATVKAPQATVISK